MKLGFLRYLAANALKYWQASVFVVLITALINVPGIPFWLLLLIQLAGFGLVQMLTLNIHLNERVRRLETLLTSFDFESASYRKEIQSYDASLEPNLSAPRRENTILMPDDFSNPSS